MSKINLCVKDLSDFVIKSKETIIDVFKIIYSLDKLEKVVEDSDSLSGVDCKVHYKNYYDNWLFTVKNHTRIKSIIEEIINDESYEVTTEEIINDESYEVTTIDFYSINLAIKVDLLLFLDHVVTIVQLYNNLHNQIKDSDFNIIDDINSELNRNFNSINEVKKLIENLLKVYMGDDYVGVLN